MTLKYGEGSCVENEYGTTFVGWDSAFSPGETSYSDFYKLDMTLCQWKNKPNYKGSYPAALGYIKKVMNVFSTAPCQAPSRNNSAGESCP